MTKLLGVLLLLLGIGSYYLLGYLESIYGVLGYKEQMAIWWYNATTMLLMGAGFGLTVGGAAILIREFLSRISSDDE